MNKSPGKLVFKETREWKNHRIMVYHHFPSGREVEIGSDYDVDLDRKVYFWRIGDLLDKEEWIPFEEFPNGNENIEDVKKYLCTEILRGH
jgi:hypothetical protein